MSGVDLVAHVYEQIILGDQRYLEVGVAPAAHNREKMI